jgi:hypothetical protein
MRLNNENNATLLSQVQGIGEKMVILEQKVLELSKENQVLKDEFSVLATRDDLQKEFTKEVRRRVMYYLKSNTSYEYILFSGTYFDNCRKHVYDIFGVPKMTRIKIDDFDLSIKAIKKWYPTQRIKDKEIQRLINLNDKGNLSKGKMRALNTYFSKTQGGIFNNAV